MKRYIVVLFIMINFIASYIVSGSNEAKKTEIKTEIEIKTSTMILDEVKPKTIDILEIINTKSEKNDFDASDNFSNKKYSWWFKNSSLRIDLSVQKMIEKYGAVYIGDTSKKIIYLTFDEGYENGYTNKILDTLKANNVKALFFITGYYLKMSLPLVKRMLDEGHQVGSHTKNHLSLPDISDFDLEKEILGFAKEYSEKLNIDFHYIKPPMGEYSERTLEATNQWGYKTIFWSYAYSDWDKQNDEVFAYKTVMNNLHNGEVLLLHAISKGNADALDAIIKGIKSEGYDIAPFDL